MHFQSEGRNFWIGRTAEMVWFGRKLCCLMLGKEMSCFCISQNKQPVCFFMPLSPIRRLKVVKPGPFDESHIFKIMSTALAPWKPPSKTIHAGDFSLHNIRTCFWTTELQSKRTNQWEPKGGKNQENPLYTVNIWTFHPPLSFVGSSQASWGAWAPAVPKDNRTPLYSHIRIQRSTKMKHKDNKTHFLLVPGASSPLLSSL